MSPAADRNLLFGILALQMDFITRDQLVAAMNAWVLDKAKPLGRILVEQKALRDDLFAALDMMVQQHVEVHNNDPQQSLASLSSVGSARQVLDDIADPDVQASLAHFDRQFLKGLVADEHLLAVADRPTIAPPSAPGAEDAGATKSYSVGESTSAGERFRILRPHAEGGLGRVSVARDEELGRDVALKEIKERYADDPGSRSRFLLEAEITGGLEHPGIVPVYGLGNYADGRPFYAMRFIRGDSLKEAIDRFHKRKLTAENAEERRVSSLRPSASSAVDFSGLDFRKLLGRFIDVCNAIAYAHSRGVLHRDLKPGNIMLGKYGETLVVDWGLGKLVERTEPEAQARDAGEATLKPASASGSVETIAGQALGTPAYMSPEQAAGRLDLLGPASDVYSLGATLYSVLTGRAPFEGSDIGVMLANVQMGEFPPPRQVNRAIDPALEAICLKAMAVKPEDRYATARLLADDIEHWLADEPVTAWPEPWTVKGRRWVGRHRVFVTGAVMALLVALGLSVFISYSSKKAAQKDRERLFDSIVSQAAAERGLGNRQRSLELLLEAAKMRPTDGVRQEAIQSIISPDIRFLNELSADYGRRITAPVFSDDDKLVAFTLLGYREPVLHIREMQSGKLLADRLDFVTPLRFRPMTSQLAIAKDLNGPVVCLWDPINEKDLGMYEGTNPVFSADGDFLATVSGKQVRIWNLKRGGEGKSPHRGTPVRFFSEKELLLTDDDGTYRRWDFTSGKETFATPKGLVGLGVSWNGHSAVLYGRQGNMNRDTILMWDLNEEKQIVALPDLGFVPTSVSFSLDDNQLAFEDSTLKRLMICVWDLPTRRLISRLSSRGLLSSKGSLFARHSWGHPGPSFSPDGLLLAARGIRGGRYQLCVWEVESGAELKTLPQVIYSWWKEQGRVLLTLGARKDDKNFFQGIEDYGENMHPFDETDVATPGRPTGHLNSWHVTNAFPTYLLDGRIRACSFKEDGCRVAVNDIVWEVKQQADGILIRRSGVPMEGLLPVFRGQDEVWAPSFISSDPSYATIWQLSAEKHKYVLPRPPFPEIDKLVSEGKLKPFVPERNFQASVVEFSPNGKRILIGSHCVLYGRFAGGPLVASPLELWDTSSLKRLAFWNRDNYFNVDDPRGQGDEWMCAKFSPDGKWVITSGRHGLRIWNVSQGNIEMTLRSIDSSSRASVVDQLAFSRDGQRILAVASGASKIYHLPGDDDSAISVATVFAMESGKELRTWEVPRKEGNWRSSAISPKGDWVVAGSEDGAIRLWDVATGRELARWKGHEEGVSVLHFHPDGKTLVSGSKDGTTRLWNLPLIRKELSKLGVDWQ